MFFNWYTSEWWYDKAGSCAGKADELENVIDTSIVLDHYPRIDKDRLDEPNVANIVSICKNRAYLHIKFAYVLNFNSLYLWKY